MSIRNVAFSLALAALALPSISFAQEGRQATVLLRNGERVSGILEAVDNNTVFVRVSQHDQRKHDVREVALIDFVGGATGLPQTELDVAKGPGDLVLLRDGSSMKGNFVDISGGEAGRQGEKYELVFRTDGQERREALANVSRIYLGDFPTAAVANSAATAEPSYTSNQALPAGAIRVPANTQWVATPLTVRKGDRVTFNVSGQVQLSSDAGDVARAAGATSQRKAAGSPLPQNFAGALIARVGNSAPFPIGDQSTPVTMPADGQLYLGVNDDEVGDNRGEFVVQMQHQRARR